jgi:hypothetical protein
MAFLYVSEYPSLPVSGAGESKSNVIPAPPLVEQKLAIGSTSQISSAFSPRTGLLVIETDATCSISFGTTSSLAATSASQRLYQNEAPRYYAVQPNTYVAVITNT